MSFSSDTAPECFRPSICLRSSWFCSKIRSDFCCSSMAKLFAMWTARRISSLSTSASRSFSSVSSLTASRREIMSLDCRSCSSDFPSKACKVLIPSKWFSNSEASLFKLPRDRFFRRSIAESLRFSRYRRRDSTSSCRCCFSRHTRSRLDFTVDAWRLRMRAPGWGFLGLASCSSPTIKKKINSFLH